MKKLKLDLKPMVKKFEVFAKKNTISELGGNYMSVFKGKGLDFAGYREYTHQDDSNEIDWKATLRANQTLIKKMEEERNIKVFFLFDVSDSMLFASTKKLKCEYGAEIVAALSFGVLSAGDSVGIAMFSDKTNKLIPLNMGPQHYYRIIKELTDPSNYGGKFSFGNVLKFLNTYLPSNSIVIVVSDFIGLGNTWRTHFRIASKKYDFLFLVMVRDPVDNQLPLDTGQITMQDPFSTTKLLVDPNLMAQAFQSRSSEIKQKIKVDFMKQGCDTLELLTTESFERKISGFFGRARKRWR